MNWQEFILGDSTEQQKEAIMSQKPLTVVSAGAGAGKTQTLAQRFAWLLANDESCAAQQILVLTFTKKAAQEMRERIDSQLKKLYNEYGSELPFLKERIEQLEDADISTLDSFAMKITREAGLSLDIDPAFTIVSAPFEELFWQEFTTTLDELSTKKLQRLCGDNAVWKQRAAELFGHPLFPKFVNCYRPEHLAQAARNAVFACGSMDKDREGNAVNSEWLWNFTNEKALSELQENKFGKDYDLKKQVVKEWRRVIVSSEFAAIKNNNSDKKIEKALLDAANFIDETEDKFVDELLKVLSNLHGQTKDFQNLFTNFLYTSPKDYRDTLIHNLFLSAKPSAEEKELLSLLNKTAALGWHCWEQKKSTSNCLSVNDLIQKAKEVLENNPECGEKYRHIMVDEFQDTNPQQNALLEKLWKGLNAENPNTLFVVGDIKQSIYRFRHADLTLFKNYIDAAKHSDCAQYINLDKNFRSTKALLGIFNDTFTDIWQNSMGDIELNYPNGKEDAFEDCAFDLISYANKKKGGLRTDDARFELYKALAKRITELRGSVTVYDKEKKTRRTSSWKDFTVLAPTRTSYGAIEKAFEYAGIPYVLCTSRDYYGRDEIRVLINLVTLFSTKNDALALAAWLASPFCDIPAGETERMISAAAADGVNNTLWQIVKEHYPNETDRIEKLSRIAKLRGVSAALMEIQRDREYLKAYAPSQRRRVATNVAGLIEATREYENSVGGSLAGCAEYLQNAVSSAQQKEEPEIADSSQDCVKVMTIHASKGLEFPIAILAETQRNRKISSDTVKISPTLGLLVNKLPDFIETGDSREIVSAQWHADLDKAEQDAEYERCWYVAMTRAREKLIMCGTQTETAKQEITNTGFLKKFLNTGQIAHNTTDIRSIDAKNLIQEKAEKAEQTAESAPAEIEPLKVTQFTGAMLSRITASAYAMIEWCPAAYRTSFRQGIKQNWENENNGEDSSSGQAFGNIVHQIMRRWDFTTEELDEFLCDKFADKLSDELKTEFAKGTTRQEIRQILTDFAKTETAKMLTDLAKKDQILQREASFRAHSGELLLVGATDLYWEDEKVYHILDWKTGGESDATNTYYLPQLKFYAAALWLAKKDTDKRPDKIGIRLVHLRTPESEETFLMPDELDKIAEKVTSAAQRAVSGDFTPQTDKCSGCPWKNSCKHAK